ncbi:MAG: hypothetical protein ACRDG3_08955 [Tepidiformaceae bacterium]
MPKPDQVVDPALRTKIEAAHQQMRAGDGTAAVKTLADAYLSMMEMKPSLLDEKVEMRPGVSIPLVMRWPALGANLLLASVHEKKPVIEFSRERFAISEAITYYEFTLESAIREKM